MKADWKIGVSRVVEELLAAKPLSWKPLEALPRSEAVELIFRQMAKKGGKSLGKADRLFKKYDGGKGKNAFISFLDKDKDGERWKIIAGRVNDLADWCRETARQGKPGKGMYLACMGKNEPYKKKKLDQGRHRSIQFPEWCMSALQRLYCDWYEDVDVGLPTERKEVRTVDDLMALFDRESKCDIRWMAGGDARKVCGWAHQQDAGCLFASYDVEGWDRSLDPDVVEHLFQCLIRDPAIASSLAFGMCKDGCYHVGNVLIALPDGSFVWCSGNLLTLAGNCLMHQGLLRALGLKGIVQGDDGVIAYGSASSADVPALFARAGLKLKECVFSAEHFNFCKVDFYPKVSECVLKINDMMDKVRAGHGKKVRRGFLGLCAGLHALSAALPQVGYSMRVSSMRLSQANEAVLHRLQTEERGGLNSSDLEVIAWMHASGML